MEQIIINGTILEYKIIDNETLELNGTIYKISYMDKIDRYYVTLEGRVLSIGWYDEKNGKWYYSPSIKKQTSESYDGIIALIESII